VIYELVYRGNCFDILMFREILGNKYVSELMFCKTCIELMKLSCRVGKVIIV